MIIEFDQSPGCTLKSLAMNINNVIKAKSRFFNGKMLMLDKLYLMSSIYDLIEAFYFPDQKIKEIYETY